MTICNYPDNDTRQSIGQREDEGISGIHIVIRSWVVGFVETRNLLRD